MDHKKILELLPAYMDQELDISDMLAVERHLESCPDCQREYLEQRGVNARMRDALAYFDAPVHLAKRINAALAGDRMHYKDWIASRFNAGAAMAVLLAAAWSIGLYLSLPSAQDRLIDEVIASHVRSLQVDHLSDVASSDLHTVKPWFNGKLNFSPPVVDLTPQGFPLVGGRLDYLAGRPVAALIYRHNQHPINLYIWPTDNKDTALQVQTRQGYHLVRWTTDGMNYWMVSDLAITDLEKFARIVRSTLRQ